MAAVPRFAYIKTTIVARQVGDVNVEYVVDVFGMQYAGISGGKRACAEREEHWH